MEIKCQVLREKVTDLKGPRQEQGLPQLQQMARIIGGWQQIFYMLQN